VAPKNPSAELCFQGVHDVVGGANHDDQENSGRTTPKTSGGKTIPTPVSTVWRDDTLFIEQQIPGNLEHQLQPQC